MKLESIEVGNFRNYENAKLEFHQRPIFFMGIMRKERQIY